MYKQDLLEATRFFLFMNSCLQVPIGPLALMPGNLIHTNEIMVLLGDNWFAERSATQAVDIAKRRLKSKSTCRNAHALTLCGRIHGHLNLI